MTNKEIVGKVNEGFNSGDTEAILSYVTDDVTWECPGFFDHKGKEAFRREINNDAFTGKPAITIINELEDGDLAAVEGSVKSTKKNGSPFSCRFFDIYRLQDGKIKEMRSYLTDIK
ncbi:MAG: nuclear transport factor 2 family protein [Ignavibacteria bacterium]